MTTKPRSKHERNVEKALARSLRNQPKGFRPRRKVRRLQARLGQTSAPTFTREDLANKNRDELREICASNKIAFTTRLRKDALIDLIVGK